MEDLQYLDPCILVDEVAAPTIQQPTPPTATATAPTPKRRYVRKDATMNLAAESSSKYYLEMLEMQKRQEQRQKEEHELKMAILRREEELVTIKIAIARKELDKM